MIYFNNIKFTRDDKTGYYLNSTIRKRLHRYVWEFYNGEIPKGYDIHHIDGDKSNNDISNLLMLPKSKHTKHHESLRTKEFLERRRTNIREKALPEAIKWHKSKEGREWHKQHSLEIAKNLKEKEFKCLHCGAIFHTKPCGTVKFCSNKCKSGYRRKSGVDNIEKICENCGGVFIGNKYSKSRFCSRKCSQSAKNNKITE